MYKQIGNASLRVGSLSKLQRKVSEARMASIAIPNFTPIWLNPYLTISLEVAPKRGGVRRLIKRKDVLDVEADLKAHVHSAVRTTAKLCCMRVPSL